MMTAFRRWRTRLYWTWRVWRWERERRRRRGRWGLALVVAALAAAAGLAGLSGAFRGAGEIVGPAAVTDGDTLAIAGHPVRLDGLDAPELRQNCRRSDGSPWPCGQMAAEALSLLLRGEPVVCRVSGADRYGRSLARCWSGGEEINARLVREGWAVAYTRYSWRYLPQQALAWWEGRGIWQGPFEHPEEWRRANQR
ncbi:MAG: thermonuclease family protein [Acetobacteraceae bacterium]|nr:thermonuclease family protein [Acetobacteraceae bacterium]